MQEALERLRAAAEHADSKVKAQPDHKMSVRMEVSPHGVLVVVQLENEFRPRLTENRKLVPWLEIEHAHINVLTKRIDELTAQMLGEL